MNKPKEKKQQINKIQMNKSKKKEIKIKLISIKKKKKKSENENRQPKQQSLFENPCLKIKKLKTIFMMVASGMQSDKWLPTESFLATRPSPLSPRIIQLFYAPNG